MTVNYVFYRVEGNTGPDLSTQLVGVDLSTLNALSVTLRHEDGTSVSRAAVIDDASAGLFHIVWEDGDLIVGDHRFEYVIVDASDYVTRYPSDDSLRMIVRPTA